MTIRETFIIGCQQIGQPLLEIGFKPFQKGQLLKKLSQDKEFTFEIYFQSLHSNWSGVVALIPHIRILSKNLKKWRQKKYDNDSAGDLIFQTRLENLTPLKNKNYDWNVSLNNQDSICKKLSDLLIKYAIPLFNIFDNKTQAVDFIVNNGVKFNEHFNTKFQELPIDFLCCCGDQISAQKAFDNYLTENKLSAHCQRIYDELKASEQTYLTTVKHAFDRMFNLAYINDLKINI